MAKPPERPFGGHDGDAGQCRDQDDDDPSGQFEPEHRGERLDQQIGAEIA